MKNYYTPAYLSTQTPIIETMDGKLKVYKVPMDKYAVVIEEEEVPAISILEDRLHVYEDCIKYLIHKNDWLSSRIEMLKELLEKM